MLRHSPLGVAEGSQEIGHLEPIGGLVIGWFQSFRLTASNVR